jgi:hypothetical protein
MALVSKRWGAVSRIDREENMTDLRYVTLFKGAQHAVANEPIARPN